MQKILLLIFVFSLLTGCLSNRVIFSDIDANPDKATITGSRTMINGARVDAYVIAINGVPIEHNNNYNKLTLVDPGTYQLTIQTSQCHIARHTFNVTLQANNVYVAQGTTVDYHTHEIWFADMATGKEVTDRVHALKSGTCFIPVFF